MRSQEAIQGRLDGLHLAYTAIPGDCIDTTIETMIQELNWVLEDDTPIKDMPRSQPWTSGEEVNIRDLIS